MLLNNLYSTYNIRIMEMVSTTYASKSLVLSFSILLIKLSSNRCYRRRKVVTKLTIFFRMNETDFFGANHNYDGLFVSCWCWKSSICIYAVRLLFKTSIYKLLVATVCNWKALKILLTSFEKKLKVLKL